MKKIIVTLILLINIISMPLYINKVKANEVDTITTTIAGHNLAFEDNVYVMYYVLSSNLTANDEEGVYLWKDKPLDFSNSNFENAVKLKRYEDEVIDGITYSCYYYTGCSAAEMTTNLYAVSYVKSNGSVVYSQLDKYSILEYAYNKKGSTYKLSDDGITLGEYLTSMLNYGAASQKYFGINLSRLANATYYKVKVENGVINNSYSTDLCVKDEIIKVTPKEVEDMEFMRWEDEEGNIVSEEKEYTFSVTSSLTLVAKYKEKIPEGLEFELTSSKDSYKVVNYTGSATKLVIPKIYDGLPVVEIADNAFSECINLTSITIPKGVTSIGEDAFAFCKSLTSITIPEGVTSIGEDAFSYCSSLTSITIPEGVTSIKDRAFHNCSSLTSITIPNSVTSIGERAFYDCSSLTSITIPEGVTSIGEYAFYDCSSLTSITIPNSVTSIGSYAFERCFRLVEIVKKSSLNISKGSKEYGYIGYYALNIITDLSQSKLTTDENGFVSIDNNGVKTLVNYLGNERNIIIPSDIEVINQYAFCYCSNLTSIAIPEGVTSIGQCAFYACSSLTSITIPESVTEIGNSAFSGCSSLTIYCIASSPKSGWSSGWNFYHRPVVWGYKE